MDINQNYVFSRSAKNTFIILSISGLVLVALGAIFGKDTSSTRIWANFLLTNYLFTAIGVVATGWIAIQYISNAGWSTAFKRIPEAMGGFIPVGLVGMVIIIAASFIPINGHHYGIHTLYEWSHLDNPEVLNDEVLSGKRAYLNVPFFIIRAFLYFAVWIIFTNLYRRYSLNEDREGGIKYYNKSLKLSAAFVPIMAITFCFAAYDWFMSLEPHWYSTIYAVNMFAGVLVTTCVLITMCLVLLRKNGYMGWINDSHFHDLSKFIFGFSIFWMYTWTAQFLLIWYANLPEEIPYFLKRMHGGWNILFFANILINFATPFLALMMRAPKRNPRYMFGLCIVLLVGRYIDWYLLSMPGTAGDTSGFGFYEVGFFLFYLGLFGFVTAMNLAKAPLMPQNHPFLEESLHHDI